MTPVCLAVIQITIDAVLDGITGDYTIRNVPPTRRNVA